MQDWNSFRNRVLLLFCLDAKKVTKKINPPRRTKIKELAGGVNYFKVSAGSDSLDFLTADI